MSEFSVLVVEDESSFAEALTLGLAREGFAVTVAGDGGEALKRFEEIDPDVVLAIPANYYVDLEARFGLDQDALTFLRRHNVLYDRTDDGIFFHLYTREIHGVFFEFVERAGYHGFGAANAPVRLAAQSRDRG